MDFEDDTENQEKPVEENEDVDIEDEAFEEPKYSFTKEDLDWISITAQALSDDNFIVERYFEALVQLNVNLLGK
jgi:hypothetical protein